MKIINHSALPNDLAERTVRECVLAYETLYGGPSCKVEFILCDSEDALEKEDLSTMFKVWEDQVGHYVERGYRLC